MSNLLEILLLRVAFNLLDGTQAAGEESKFPATASRPPSGPGAGPIQFKGI
jgi:hypothetical protein